MAKAKQIKENVYSDEKTQDTFGAKATLAPGVEVQQLETKSEQQLVDAGTGEKVVIRIFEFDFEQFRGVVPSKQYIFNQHAQMIRHFLWKDGLEACLEVEPKVMVSKRKKRYRIFVTARARFGQMWNDKATTLQDIFKQ